MAASRVIFDTSLFVEYVRKKEKETTLFHKFASIYVPVTTSITVFELWFGARTAKAKETVERLLRDIQVLFFDDDAAMIAAQEQNRLREKNRQVDIRDLFIGSIVLANDLALVTHNQKHFANFGNLRFAEVPH